MILIPAIDLRGGRVVRLSQGDYDRETHYGDDAVDLAQRYAAAGAHLIHLVDLDGARSGLGENIDTIERICKAVDCPVQTGGGVREFSDVQRRLDAGAARVVIGSLCVREPTTVCKWLGQLGPEAIVAGLDVSRTLDGQWIPKAAGWTEAGELDLFSLLDRLVDAGLIHLLCTDIERDGMMSGPSLELYQSISERFSGVRLQASGGVSKAEDLKDASLTGAAGCIVGRALLEDKIDIHEIARWSPSV
ncbi:MAG: 1-(5-phosphoribosyl)-5-[(5-phosphoribosylamino)methylideneamino]imidazole-4-carboxamide isomerase [Pseudomonadota bacterium]